MFAPRALDRRIVLAVVLAAIVPAFALTQLLVRSYRSQRQELAGEWSRRGEHDLAASPEAAVLEFQTALSYGPDRARDRFLMARALVAAGRSAEAKAELLTLSAEEPGKADVNLDLARLTAAGGDVEGAVRYYDAAIDGAWDSGAATARRETRLELARLLMSHGQQARAQAELIGLIDELPSDSALVTEVGSLLLTAGAPARALTLFQRALEIDPANARASRLAGEVEFRAGDFRSARRHFSDSAAHQPLDPAASDMLDVSQRALALDPYVDRLGVRTRARRALEALAIAAKRLDRCQPAAGGAAPTAERLASLHARAQAGAKATALALERNADLIDETMALVFEVERLPAGLCGADSADDRALAAIAGQHSGSAQ